MRFGFEDEPLYGGIRDGEMAWFKQAEFDDLDGHQHNGAVSEGAAVGAGHFTRGTFAEPAGFSGSAILSIFNKRTADQCGMSRTVGRYEPGRAHHKDGTEQTSRKPGGHFHPLNVSFLPVVFKQASAGAASGHSDPRHPDMRGICKTGVQQLFLISLATPTERPAGNGGSPGLRQVWRCVSVRRRKSVPGHDRQGHGHGQQKTGSRSKARWP